MTHSCQCKQSPSCPSRPCGTRSPVFILPLFFFFFVSSLCRITKPEKSRSLSQCLLPHRREEEGGKTFIILMQISQTETECERKKKQCVIVMQPNVKRQLERCLSKTAVGSVIIRLCFLIQGQTAESCYIRGAARSRGWEQSRGGHHYRLIAGILHRSIHICRENSCAGS